MTDFECWIRKVNIVIANGGVDGDASVSDLVLAIRSDDSLTKWEKEALIHRLWEAF